MLIVASVFSKASWQRKLPSRWVLGELQTPLLLTIYLQEVWVVVSGPHLAPVGRCQVQVSHSMSPSHDRVASSPATWHGTCDMWHGTSHWMTCYDGALPCLTITSGEILIISRPWLQNITECSTKSTDAKCLMFIVAIVTRIVFNTLIVTPLLCNAVSHHQALHYSAHHLSLIFLYKQQHSHFIIILICHSLHFNWSICWHRHTLQQVD